MKLDNMFKKTRRPSGKKGHIGGKHQSPEVPEGLLCKCNKCQKAIITEDVITGGYICPKCQRVSGKGGSIKTNNWIR